MASGCGGADPAENGSGGGGASSSGSGPATTNHDFDTATPIELNGPSTRSALVDTATKDFFKFAGKAGQTILIGAFAQLLYANSSGGDPAIIDVVVTLFDANKKQLARNDDMWPTESLDSQLFTVLPADGDYYVSVEDCHSAFDTCGKDDVSTLDYELIVAELNKLRFPDVVEGVEPNDTDMTSKLLPYKVPMGNMAGSYGFYIVNGLFAGSSDIDAFSLSIPADTKALPNQRPHANFWLQPISPEGNGATANAKVWLADAADLQRPIALIDQTNHGDDKSMTGGSVELSVPVQVGHQYYLFAQHAGGASTPATDFYFMTHFVGSYAYEPRQLEKSPDANDTLATAEQLTKPQSFVDGLYFLDGDISVAGTDVDHYGMAVSAGAKGVSLGCEAQRAGSGLRGAKFSLLKADGTPLSPDSSVTEAANTEAVLAGEKTIPLAAGETSIILKVEAASQDPAVSGTYYHCFIRTR
jgi:hypothetical protein